MRKTTLFIIFLIFLLLCGYFLLKQLQMSPLERTLEKIAPNILGQADNYQVKISQTSYFNLLSGHIKQIDLTALKLQTKTGPLIKRFTIRLEDILFNKDEIKSIGETKFQADLSQEDINEFISKKKPEDIPLKVELAENEVILLLSKKFLIFKVPVKIKGALSVEDKNKICFVCSEISISQLNIPKFIKDLLYIKANPVADLSNLPAKVAIEEILIKNKRLIIKGQAQIRTPILFNLSKRL